MLISYIYSPIDDHTLRAAVKSILPSTHGSTLEHRIAYTDVYSMTRLIVSKDTDIHARSHTRKNSAESSPSHTGLPARIPPPSCPISPLRTFFERFPPLGRVYSREQPFIPIDPFHFHASLSLNPFARSLGPRAQPGEVEEATPAPQTDLSYTCACHAISLYAFP